MYKILLMISLLISLNAMDDVNTTFKPNYSFSNINLNYFDWTHYAENSSDKSDFSYLGFEGGVGWNSVDLYGFLNIENPTHTYNENSSDELRFSSLVDLDIEIKNSFKLHIQNFSLNSGSYYVNDFVLGIGYKYRTDYGLWVRPFVGVHHTYDTYYSGFNGYMGGWLLNYDFKLFEQKFSMFQWNEIEFGRDKNFYLNENHQAIGDGASWGLNGAISLWMHFTQNYTTGLQYRYAKNKLGSQNYQSGVIYTIKYNF